MASEDPKLSQHSPVSASEESRFFNLSLDLLAIAGMNGQFKRVNQAWTQTLGYSEAELLDRPFIELIHPEDQAATLEELERLRAGNPTPAFVNRYRAKDGTYRCLSWTASPEIEREEFYCIARDVTQQRATEAALRESEERWQLALRGSNDGIWDWNVRTNEVFFSARWKSMLGFEDYEISNHLDEWGKRVHPDDLGWVMQTIQDHFEGKTPFYRSEHRVRCKDGTYKWILDRGQAIWDEAGNVLRMAGSHTDVTERHELEAALQTAKVNLEQRVAERTAELQAANSRLHESERRWRTAVDYIPDVFVIYDAERRIQFINAAGLALTERPLEDFIGYRDEDIHPSEVTGAYLPLLLQAVATKQYQTGECTITLPNRTPYTIVVQYVPLLDNQGAIQQILGITYDITKRKQAEEAILRSEKQVRRVLDSLFSFVGVMTPDGTLIEANRTALDAANLKPEDVLNNPFEETFWWSYDTEVQAKLRVAIHRAAAGEIVRYDAIVRVRDHQLVTIDFTLVPVFDDTGQVEYLIPSGIDISDRKRAEVALLQSQIQIQRQLTEIETIYQSAPIGLNVLDRDLRFVRINERLAEINGLSVEEHLGRTVREVLPELADTAEALLYPVIETGAPLLNVEIRGETPAQPGVERVWLESFLPLKDGHRVIGINTVCEEITERMQVEEALRQSEARFRQMADNAPVMVWVTDPTGYCTFLSQSWYDFTGQTEATGLAFGWLDVTHPDDLEQARGIFMEANARQEAFRLEYRLRRRDGEYRWAIDAGNPWFGDTGEFKGYIGSVIDITERKQAEAALQRSEERYRTLFETMEDGFCILQMIFDADQKPVDYRFLEANPAFQEQTGLQQAVGYTARELIPDLEEHWFETYGNVARQREPLRFEQGSEAMGRWFEVYAFPIGAPAEHKVALLFKDVSDRKAIENQRERLLHQEQTAREAAEQANRMKDEFLAILSHELRTPLNPIMGWAKLLQAPRVDAKKLQQGLESIERNAKQQIQLINDLLDISRIIRGQMSLDLNVVNPVEPIINAMETVHFAAEAKGIQISTQLDESVGPVRGDIGRLQQVIWNLLSNAIKFTPRGGQVEVRLELAEERRKVEEQEHEWGGRDGVMGLGSDGIGESESSNLASRSPFTPSNQQAQITVSDTGQGIHSDFLPQVFTLFKQQDSSITRSFGGLGLGLAIVKQVVEAHGGTITAASPGVGQGATFTVFLPLVLSTQAESPDNPHPETLNLRNRQVIVVDDEVDSLELVKVILEAEGANVFIFSSSTKALKALSKYSFDLLISDIGMPNLDGYALMAEIRRGSSINQDIPAIALTAYAGERDQRKATSAGYQAHLAKPVDMQKLLTASSRLVSI
jgi:PAS domain S-box-containing protein